MIRAISPDRQPPSRAPAKLAVVVGSSCLRRGACVAILLAGACGFTTPAVAAPPKQEAAALSVVAGAKAKAGAYTLCSEMYEQCYRLDPGFLGYLYSAARCAQKGGQLDVAERHYREFLLRSPAEHPLRKRADGHMNEIMVARRAASDKRVAEERVAAEAAAAAAAARGPGSSGSVAAPAPAATGVAAAGGATKSAPPMTRRALAGWGAVGGAVILGSLGTWLLLNANADASALEADLALPAGTQLIRGLTYAEAVQRDDEIRSGRTMAVIVGGGALLAAAAGAWLLIGDEKPAKSTLRLSPIPGRLGAVWELRW